MKINHLGIATKSIEDALTFWVDGLGLENVHTEIVEDQKVRVAMLPVGESRIELLEPTADDSRFVMDPKAGEPGRPYTCSYGRRRPKCENWLLLRCLDLLLG